MECTVRWTGEGMSFLAETGSNHLVAMDGASDGGGRNLAPRPMEIVLVGTGGCTAYDVVVILKKSGQDVTGCEVKLTSERAPTSFGLRENQPPLPTSTFLCLVRQVRKALSIP